jgi:endonuclease/exonuclease/phosphatase family metal-dependent hydrolase
MFKKLKRGLKWLGIFMFLLIFGTVLFFTLRPEGEFTPAGTCSPEKTSDVQQIKILTWNILRGADEGLLGAGWDKRKHSFETLLSHSDYDILCFQEVLPEQLAFFKSLLDDYHCIAVGRLDGRSKGEHCPIFFKMDRFQLIQSDTFWLSPTPDEPGRGWGEYVPRICTWAELKDMSAQNRFRIYNTHLHLSPYAQYHGAKLLAERIQNVDIPVILAGDLNAPPGWPPLRVLEDAGLTRAESSGALTYHVNGKGIRCLDHILYDHNWEICEGNLLKNRGEKVYPSDHFGLWVGLYPTP